MPRSDESGYVPALGFRWLTPAYDVAVRLTTREGTFRRLLIAQSAIEPGHRVLDVGCGTGTLSIWLKEAHPLADVIGIDGDPEVLALASRKATEAGVTVHFEEALSRALPFADSHFDRVVSSLFFHHLSWDEKESTMREIHRVLKPGGEVHVADWGKATDPLMRALFVPVQLLDGFRNTEDNVSGRLVELFGAAGLVQVSETKTLGTMLGTVALYRAAKPA